MRSLLRPIVVVFALTGLLAPSAASAQTGVPAPAPVDRIGTNPAAGGLLLDRGGWVVAPALTYGGNWDDNVLIQETGDNNQGDFQNAITPSLNISFNGRRSDFNADYSGAFIRYVELSSLNSYDQHADVSVRRLLTKHSSFFASNTFTASPTTQVSELVGVPFLRTGSTVENMRTGFDVELSKHTTLGAAYNFEWIAFDDDPELGVALAGGHSHGASLSFRRSLNDRLALTGDYSLQHATVVTQGGFNIHNGYTGVEYRTSPALVLSAAFGLSRLGVTQFAPAQWGPAWRAGLSRDFELARLDVNYSRSFVPSYSFGGTLQNEEAIGRVSVPFSTRAFLTSSAAWRKNEPLEIGGDRLKSFLAGASLGYAVQPWLTIEGFYDGTFQNIDRPGGRLNRNRFGIQLTTTKPMRIR